MTRTRLLIAAAAGVVGLSALIVPAALAGSSPTTATSATTTAPNNNGNGVGCGYPSNRKPGLTLTTTPSSIKKGQSTSPSGKLIANGCAVRDRKMGLYAQPGSKGTFSLVDTQTTDSGGVATFRPQQPATTTTYKALFVGDADYDAATSNLVLVTVTK